MAKKESTFMNMVLTLLIVTLVASTALGYLYEFTKEPIAAAKLKKKVDAIRLVVPEFTNDPNTEMFKLAVPGTTDSLEVYPAKNNGETVGYAVNTFTKKGFSGLVKLMVGFQKDGTIYNISVLEHTETPGLGDKMTKKKHPWSLQFNGKNPGQNNIKVKQDGGEIDAITASTISSRAYIDAVERAYLALEGQIKE